MTPPTPARRWLALGATVAVFGGVLAIVAFRGPKPEAAERADAKAKDVLGRDPGTWPLFGGSVQRNFVNLVDKNIPTEFSVSDGTLKNIKWSVDLGTKAYGGPVISGGKIFVGTNNGQPRNKRDTEGGKSIDKGVMMCFEEKTGKFLWQAVYDKLAQGRVSDWPEEGICSSPVVEGDRLWFVSNRAEITCASTNGYAEGGKLQPTHPKYTDKTDAGIIWRYDMIKEKNVFPHNLSTCSPLIVGDTLFVITSNGVDEGHINIPQPKAPSFLALNKNTGKVLWESNLPSIDLIEEQKDRPGVTLKTLVDEGKVLMHGQWSNPVYAEPNGKPMIIFPGGDGWMRAFNPADGKLLWKFDCNPKASFYVLGGKGTRNDFVSTPVVWENKLYIGVGQDPEHNKGVGHLWCIDITKEPKNKELDLSPYSAKDDPNPKFDPKDPKNKDSGLVWHYGGETPKGSKYKRPYLYGRSLSTVMIHDGLAYAGEYDGYVHCFDARTGEQYWEHKMDQDTWSSPYWVDGKIYIGNEAGQILVFKHGKTKELINTIDLDGCLVRATPVVVNGVMYVITENPCKLYAISPGGK